MKNKTYEMPPPSQEVLAQMIQDLKNVNAAVAANKESEEANELRGNYYLRKNFNQEWLNALPSRFSKERDEIINLILDLGETVAHYNIKMSYVITKHTASIHTDNQEISEEITSMVAELKEMSTEENEVARKKERKSSVLGFIFVIYIIFKITMMLLRD